MLVFKKNQQQDWDVIKKLLTEQGIEFYDLTSEQTQPVLSEVRLIGGHILEEVAEQSNAKKARKEFALIGMVAEIFGTEHKEIELEIIKEKGYDYGSGYHLDMVIDEEYIPFLMDEEEEIEDTWLEGYVSDRVYNLDMSQVALDESIDIKVPVPTNKISYKIV